MGPNTIGCISILALHQPSFSSQFKLNDKHRQRSASWPKPSTPKGIEISKKRFSFDDSTKEIQSLDVKSITANSTLFVPLYHRMIAVFHNGKEN